MKTIAVTTEAIRSAVSWIAWPTLLAACAGTTAVGFAAGQPVIAFNLTYLALAAALLILERWTPHEREWSRSDGQLHLDLAHTLFTNGTIQVLVAFGGVIGLSGLVASQAEIGVWPRHWPLAFQIALGLALSEFAGYWAHRLAHEWRSLWHFHAIHHSVEKLWCVNSGRFHFVDALKSVVPGAAILVIAGAPAEVLAWLSALTGYVGILTHCNVAMRFGALSYVFNTPELHRWHHSRDLREGNKNYGENIVLWDLVFGTYFNEARRPPADIGVSETIPSRFGAQLAWPFRQAFAAPPPLPDLPPAADSLEAAARARSELRRASPGDTSTRSARFARLLRVGTSPCK